MFTWFAFLQASGPSTRLGYGGSLHPSEALSLTAGSVHVTTARPNASADRAAVTKCPFSDNRGYAPANRAFVADWLIRLKPEQYSCHTFFDISIADFEAACQAAKDTTQQVHCTCERNQVKLLQLLSH